MNIRILIIIIIFPGMSACVPHVASSDDLLKLFRDNESAYPYEISIPKDTIDTTIIWHGGHESIRTFVFADSSLLYIHMFSMYFPIGHNSDLILEMMDRLEWCNTSHVDLGGVHELNELYWRDVKIGDTRIGYRNVQESDVVKLDRAVASFRPLLDYRVEDFACW